MGGLALLVTLPCVPSDAVTVALPAVLSVTERVCVLATSAELEGRLALLSEELRPTTSVMLVTRFQKASTALTVALKAAPAVWALGVPVLPMALPGTALSPGTN